MNLEKPAIRKDGIKNVKGQRVKVPVWIRGDISLHAHTSGVPGNLVLSSDGSIGVSTESQYQETIPGWLTGRRPTTGQLYPRGVFNK